MDSLTRLKRKGYATASHGMMTRLQRLVYNAASVFRYKSCTLFNLYEAMHGLLR